MAIARVGSLGTVATGTSSCSPTFGQSTTAGNLLICWAVGVGATVDTPAGWSKIALGSNPDAAILYKPNCGAGETAPTVTGPTSFVAAMLGEFSGAATVSPLDVSGSVGTASTTSPSTVTASGADAASGELACTASVYFYSMAATKTTTHSINNGTLTGGASNDGTSTVNHYRFGAYAITTANASADANTDTFTITAISFRSSIIASFKVAPAATTAPPFSNIPRRRSLNRTRV